MWQQKGRLFDVLISNDNWYVTVLPPVEEEIRRVIRNERAKEPSHNCYLVWSRSSEAF